MTSIDARCTVFLIRTTTAALEDGGLGIAVDSSGHAYVAGFFGGSSTFGLGEADETIVTSAGGADIFLAKYTNDSPVDLDVSSFRVTNRMQLSRVRPLAISVTVTNKWNGGRYS